MSSKDWVLLRLGDFLSELPKSTLPASCAEANGAYAFYCSSSEPKMTDTWLQEHPAILMGTGGVASVHLGKGRYAYSTDTWAIRIKESSGLMQPYAYRVLELSISKIDYVGFEGSGLRHLRKSYIKDFRFLAPSGLAPQKRIASILDCIDTAVEKTEALIAKYRQIKAGLMHDLFTRGVLPNGQLRPPREQAPELYQETAIGWIPREWEIRPLGQMCEMTSGGTPSRSIPAYWGGKIPWVKTGEIKYEDISRTEEYITPQGLAASSATVFSTGTIVMAMYGEGVTRGRVAMLAVPCASNQACIGFSFSNQIQTKYMYHFFTHCYEELRDLSNDGSQKNLSSGLLKKFQICFPVSKTEQDCIANRLSKLDKYIASEKNFLKNLCQQKIGLMHDLLTGKVPVKAEEPEVVDGY